MGFLRRVFPQVKLDVDFQRIEDDDGKIEETCWFCGRPVAIDLNAASSEYGSVVFMPSGPGETLRGTCHTACAERSKGALDPERH